ncbi:MAG: glycosyltransferase family 4 protein [Pseudomonadota bacterium]
MVRVAIIHPADPLGIIPGGIDTCIRDIIRSAPQDFEFSLFGATTDTVARPVGKWTTCQLGETAFRFFPLYAIADSGVQSRIPATVKHMAGLYRSGMDFNFDVLQFHRIEPIVRFWNSGLPMYCFMHQDMSNITSKGSDIRWKHVPWLYFAMERQLIPRLKGVFCVHRNAVASYNETFSDVATNFDFVPTWMNPDVFFPADGAMLEAERTQLESEQGIRGDARLITFVGRIDKQKNPERLIQAFATVADADNHAHLLVIGDGVLKPDLERDVEKLGLTGRVTLTGILANDLVARRLRVSDVLLLASDYEGMPRCVVEALGCGVPVVTTDVGEVRKVVHHGVNGFVDESFTPEALAADTLRCLGDLQRYRGEPCTEAVESYRPKVVLDPVYNKYRSHKVG